MTVDESARAAFVHDMSETRYRPPSDREIGSALAALSGARKKPFRTGARSFLQDLVPAFALAAACLVAALSGQPGTALPRPLAAELSMTLPADAGSRFVSFIVSAGDSLRSSGR
jgi:hypothetical protein